jgi:hypothetical protein
MDRTDAIAWVLSLCLGLLRKSQAKTLSELVAAALGATRVTLAGIGRELAALRAGAAKHAIKRAWRFVTNPRIEPAEVMPLLFNRLWRRRLKWHAKHPQRRPLLVSLDWTQVRSFHTLLAAVVVEGRALPLCWESYPDRVQSKSQNALEYGMLARLVAALPPGVRIVILADRGFGRAALAGECQRLKLDYLVRIQPDVVVQTARWRGNLKHYAVRRGMAQFWQDVTYRADGVVTTHLAIRWQKGLPADRDQPWYLITSLAPRGRRPAGVLSELYRLRFDIEEFFRDSKNEHLGWSLAKTRITRAARLDRLILVLALAYLLLVALGLWCRAHQSPRLWATNRRVRELSALAIGRVMLGRVQVAVATLVAVLLRSLATTQGKWG